MGNCQLRKPPRHPKSTVAYIGEVFYWGKCGGLLDGRMLISRNLQTSLAPCGTPSRCGSASPPLEAFVHRLGRRQLAPTPAYRCEHRVLSRRPEWWTLRITIEHFTFLHHLVINNRRTKTPQKNNKAPIQMDGEDNPSSCPDGENTVLQLSALQKGGSTTLFSFCFSKKHKPLILDHTSKPNKPRKLPPKKFFLQMIINQMRRNLIL